MNRRDVVLTIPTAIAAVGLKLEANPTPAGQRDIVRQSELRGIIDLQNRIELLAADIRKRLETGACLEAGPLGASTTNLGTLDELAKAGIGDADEIDAYEILSVAPASRIKRQRKQYPGFANETWVS